MQGIEEDAPWGMFVWMLPNGDFFADDDGNVMNVSSHTKNNPAAVKALRDGARLFGLEGKPVWLAGRRRITDEEHEEQLARERWGLIPDPLDYGALQEEARSRKNG